MLDEGPRRPQADLRLLRRYHHHGDLRARDELAARCRPLVVSVARRYEHRGEELDDLIQAGNVGLVKAIDRFDVESGNRFATYAVPNIAGEIRRHFRDHTWAVHVPRALQELDARVEDTRRALTRTEGREPSDDDVAHALRRPVADVREARRAGGAYRALPLERPGTETEDLLGTIDPGYAQVDAETTLDEILTALPPREREVVRLRSGDGLLQREIATRIGVSQMQVSRILTSALERMQEHVAAAPSTTPG